jgi:predicted RNase H-like HicB family nuclease
VPLNPFVFSAQPKLEEFRGGSSGSPEWRHEVWQCGRTKTTIPRHREINEITPKASSQPWRLGWAPAVGSVKRKTYTARCQRSGNWWAISVPELREVHTQARRLEKAEAMARHAIALFLDVPSNSIDVRIEPMLPCDLQRKVGRARKVRGEAEVLQREAAIASAEVAADLVQLAHLTVRDAGRVLGLSHQ